MQFKEYQDTIKNIDWNLLQQQKRTLEKLLTNLPLYEKMPDISNEDTNDLWGLIELIENLQDMGMNVVQFEGIKNLLN